MPPTELAPLRQDNYAWPKWGQYVETKGKSGEACDMPEAQRLLDLYDALDGAPPTTPSRPRIWREMLANHAENLWSIGTVAGALQPIVVTATACANVPTKARLFLGADRDARRLPHRRVLLGPAPAGRPPAVHARRDGPPMIGFLLRRVVTMAVTLLDHLGAGLLHHQAAAGRLPDQPDRGAARAGRGGLRRQGRVPDQAIRARPAGLAAIPRSGSASCRGRTASRACSRAIGAGRSSTTGRWPRSSATRSG